MILKKMFNSSKSETKNPLMKTEYRAYQNGMKKQVGLSVYKTWIDQISSLRNVLATTSELASGANIKFYKVDSKGKKKLIINPKQFDTMFMNDIDDVSSFLYNYFGQIKAYDNVLIIPEESKYSYRKGKVDFFISDNIRWKANPNETGKQTIDSFTYTSSMGAETIYNYEDVIFIRKPLNSSNLLYGVSRLQSLNSEISRILNMGDYVDSYIASGAKKSVIVGTDEPMNPNQQADILESFNKFLNNPNQKALMLNAEKLSVKEVSESLASTDVVNFLIKLNRTVLESYNLPKFLFGNYEGVSNSELVRLSMRVFFEVGIKPEFIRLGRHITRYARDVLGIKNILCEFDYEGISILEDSLEEKLDKAKTLNAMGAYSLNEVRLAVGEEAIENENFDLHLAPANITSGIPVTFENFYEDIDRKLDNENISNLEETNELPSGEGGEQNTEGMNGNE